MKTYGLKPLNFPWPPVLYAAAILFALLLGHVPIVTIAEPEGLLGWPVGLTFVGLAVWLDIWAVKTLIDCRTSILAHRCERHLVTRGPFRYSRNPIYVGYTLMTIGFGFLTGNSWFLVMAIAAAITTNMIAIRREEMYLLARFGTDFERYCKTTRRWL